MPGPSARSFTLKALLLLFAAVPLQASDLFWGLNGNGGDGTWNSTATNWWNGTANVKWTAGSVAVFSGTGGNVTISSGPTAGALHFVSPGYTVLPGSLVNSSGTALTVIADADVTMGFIGTGGATLTKEGSARMTLTGFTLSPLTINAGEVYAPTPGSGAVALANAPGALLTLGGSTQVTLSGGGLIGGVVQPEKDKSIVLSSFGATSFGGIIQDNGTGKISIDQLVTEGFATLTNANTYSGTTTLRDGVQFADHGSALNSTITLNGGNIILDNSGFVVGDRLSDTIPVTSSGTIELRGNATTAVQETLVLQTSGRSRLVASQPGAAAAVLNVAGFTRGSRSVLDVSGNGQVKIAGLTTVNGILPSYITSGTDWATLDGAGAIVPYAGYTDLSSGSETDNVLVTETSTRTIAAPVTRNTLKIRNDSANPTVLDLGGQGATLIAGSVISNGTGVNQINHGRLTTPASELILHTTADLNIQAEIADGGVPLSLITEGPGKLTLSGRNTYTGNTAISGSGVLAITSNESLGIGGYLTNTSGTLQALASLTLVDRFHQGTSAFFDTNGFNLTISGPSPIALTKNGAGTLALPFGATFSSVFLYGGKMVTDGAKGGSIYTSPGTSLEVSGRLTGLSFESALRLDLGGPGAAALDLTYFFGQTNGFAQKLTIDFDVGAAASDAWSISQAVPSSTSYLFAFHDLGGTQTGVDYPLISFSTSGSNPAGSAFSLAPEALAGGWRGTFKVVSHEAYVNFTQVPEPGTAWLLTTGILLVASSRRRPTT